LTKICRPLRLVHQNVRYRATFGRIPEVIRHDKKEVLFGVRLCPVARQQRRSERRGGLIHVPSSFAPPMNGQSRFSG
jgi:hypothetical protein